VQSRTVLIRSTLVIYPISCSVQIGIYRELALCDATCPTGTCTGTVRCRLCQNSECTAPQALANGGRICRLSGPFSCQLASPGAVAKRSDEELDACHASCVTDCASAVECQACEGPECSSPQALAMGGKTCAVIAPFVCQRVSIIRDLVGSQSHQGSQGLVCDVPSSLA
jgi:hypothetical protein